MNKSDHQTESLRQSPSRWPHRWAWILCCTTFPLIWVGGLVTTYDAGMAVPDWPGTFGYNLFLYPWASWFWGPWDLFIEHGHRLLGATVGLIAIAFCVSVFRSGSPGWLKGLAVFALAGVIFQGVLGGMRVLLDARQLAMIHGCVGPTFFSFTAVLVAVTSQDWQNGFGLAQRERWSPAHRMATLVLVLAFLQLGLGAQLRHVSVMAAPTFFRAFVVFHVLVALALVFHVCWLGATVVSGRRTSEATRRVAKAPAGALLAVVSLQLGLGVATWVVKYGWPFGLSQYTWTAGHLIQAKSMTQSMIVTSHVAIGSLILALAAVNLVRLIRLVRVETAAVGSSAIVMGCAT